MRRILVGFDGTDGGRRALERAVAESRDAHAHITVLTVANVPLDLDAPRNFGTPDDISESEGAALGPPPDVLAHLTEARDRLDAAGVDADLRWAAGEPAHAIVEAARAINAQAIVLGEHHHGFLGKAFGGDVDGAVQREAGCEVILA